MERHWEARKEGAISPASMFTRWGIFIPVSLFICVWRRRGFPLLSHPSFVSLSGFYSISQLGDSPCPAFLWGVRLYCGAPGPQSLCVSPLCTPAVRVQPSEARPRPASIDLPEPGGPCAHDRVLTALCGASPAAPPLPEATHG